MPPFRRQPSWTALLDTLVCACLVLVTESLCELNIQCSKSELCCFIWLDHESHTVFFSYECNLHKGYEPNMSCYKFSRSDGLKGKKKKKQRTNQPNKTRKPHTHTQKKPLWTNFYKCEPIPFGAPFFTQYMENLLLSQPSGLQEEKIQVNRRAASMLLPAAILASTCCFAPVSSQNVRGWTGCAPGLQPQVMLFQKLLTYLFFLSSVDKERYQQTPAQEKHYCMLNFVRAGRW